MLGIFSCNMYRTCNQILIISHIFLILNVENRNRHITYSALTLGRDLLWFIRDAHLRKFIVLIVQFECSCEDSAKETIFNGVKIDRNIIK